MPCRVVGSLAYRQTDCVLPPGNTVVTVQGGILPPIMGGKWKFEDFLPPMGETPGGQITGVLPPMGETLGGKLLLFAPHKGGK